MRARIISTFVLAASVLVASLAMAQSSGEATFGGQWWSQTNPEAKYREYTVLPRGAYLESYLLREMHGPWAAALWGRDAFTRSQGNGFYLAHGVRWRLDAKYTETPHLVNTVSRSPYTQVSPGVYVLPDVLQWQNQLSNGTNYNAGMLNVLAGAPLAPLRIQTNASGLRARARPLKDWQLEVKGSERDRQGTLAYGATFGQSNDIELAAPINQRTVDLDATASYSHGPARFVASVGMSDFANRVPTMVWDNPKVFRDSIYWASGRRSGLGSLGRMALWPDNKVVRGNTALSFQLPYSTMFTASVGVTRSTQEQAFIPLTINSKELADSASGLRGDDLSALPASNLDGKVTTIVQDYRLTGRPFASLYTTLRARDEQFEDQTSGLDFVYGIAATDQIISRPTATNPGPESEAWSHRNNTLGLDADYSLGRYADVSLLAERRTRTHDLREVGRDVENVLGGGLKVQPMDNLSLNANYRYGQRKLDSFDVAVYDGADRAALRRFDVADRNQSALSGSAMWSISPKLDLSANGWWNKDDYENTTVGLKSVENTQFFGEGAVHPNDDLDLSAGIGVGELKSDQASIEGGSIANPAALSNPWTSNVDDKNVYGFAHVSWWAQPKKLQLGAQFMYTRDMQSNTLGDTLTAKVADTDISMPNSFYRTQEVTLDARWHYAEGIELACRYYYTKYDVTDLLAQTVPLLNINPTTPGTAGTAIFLGAGKQSYTANRVQVSATRRF